MSKVVESALIAKFPICNPETGETKTVTLRLPTSIDNGKVDLEEWAAVRDEIGRRGLMPGWVPLEDPKDGQVAVEIQEWDRVSYQRPDPLDSQRLMTRKRWEQGEPYRLTGVAQLFAPRKEVTADWTPRYNEAGSDETHWQVWEKGNTGQFVWVPFESDGIMLKGVDYGNDDYGFEWVTADDRVPFLVPVSDEEMFLRNTAQNPSLLAMIFGGGLVY